MKKILFILFLLMSSMCSVAFADEPDMVFPAYTKKVQMPGHIFGTAGAIHFDQLLSTQSKDSFSITATVSNQRGRRDILFYRVLWIDEFNMPIGQYSQWLSESIEGFQSEVINISSPYPHAKSFRLEIHGHE